MRLKEVYRIDNPVIEDGHFVVSVGGVFHDFERGYSPRVRFLVTAPRARYTDPQAWWIHARGDVAICDQLIADCQAKVTALFGNP